MKLHRAAKPETSSETAKAVDRILLGQPCEAGDLILLGQPAKQATAYCLAACEAGDLILLGSLRSRRPHIAWGGARLCERNPRSIKNKCYEPAKQAAAQESLRCRPFHGLTPLSLKGSWGCARKASLHPRLYAHACFAGFILRFPSQAETHYLPALHFCSLTRNARELFPFLLFSDR